MASGLDARAEFMASGLAYRTFPNQLSSSHKNQGRYGSHLNIKYLLPRLLAGGFNPPWT